MMTAEDVMQAGALVLVGIALLMLAAIAYFALMRWLILIVPAIVLVGFAFDAEMQWKFTAALVGLLALLYLPPLVVAVVWRQVAGLRPVIASKTALPSPTETACQTLADDEARLSARQDNRAAQDRRDREDDDNRARDLERQGAFSFWNR
jgi:hypothetical protein